MYEPAPDFVWGFFMEKDRLVSFLTFFYLFRNAIVFAVTILALAAIIFWWYVPAVLKQPTPQLTEQAATTEESVQQTPELQLSTEAIREPILALPSRSTTGRVVTVQKGDTLWSLALREFGDGAQYKRIAEANSITNVRELKIGTKLVLPATVTEQAEVQLPSDKNVPVQMNDQQGRYTVQSGDCLWTIAAEVMGDPFRWTELYTLNREKIGANPNLIYPDTELVLPPVKFATMQTVR